MKKVGIALGGGSAHGVAHIGVLQVLRENNIPLDFVAGCSAGAIAGGLFVRAAICIWPGNYALRLIFLLF